MKPSYLRRRDPAQAKRRCAAKRFHRAFVPVLARLVLKHHRLEPDGPCLKRASHFGFSRGHGTFGMDTYGSSPQQLAFTYLVARATHEKTGLPWGAAMEGLAGLAVVARGFAAKPFEIQSVEQIGRKMSIDELRKQRGWGVEELKRNRAVVLRGLMLPAVEITQAAFSTLAQAEETAARTLVRLNAGLKKAWDAKDEPR